MAIRMGGGMGMVLVVMAMVLVVMVLVLVVIVVVVVLVVVVVFVSIISQLRVFMMVINHLFRFHSFSSFRVERFPRA